MTLNHKNGNQRTTFKSIYISTNLTRAFIFVYRMEFNDETRWSCSRNSDQTFTQLYQGVMKVFKSGSKEVGGGGLMSV